MTHWRSWAWINVIVLVEELWLYNGFLHYCRENKNYKLNRKFQNHPVFSFSRQSTFPNKNDKMPHNSTISLHLQVNVDHAENCLVLLACIYVLLLKLMKLLRTQSLEFITAHSLNLVSMPIYNTECKEISDWVFLLSNLAFLYSKNKVDSFISVAVKTNLWLTERWFSFNVWIAPMCLKSEVPILQESNKASKWEKVEVHQMATPWIVTWCGDLVYSSTAVISKCWKPSSLNNWITGWCHHLALFYSSCQESNLPIRPPWGS